MHGSERPDELADLCRRCGEGDEHAFSEVYRRFGGTLYGTAWRILKNTQEAEEIVQETFLTLYRKGAEAQPRNLGAWLHRVAANRSVDRVRARTRRAEVALHEETEAAREKPVAGPEPAEVGRLGDYGIGIDLERAIELLPDRTRMVFVLHDVEGFKHREIGDIMGISDGSSKSQLFRARAMLRKQLQVGETGE